MTGRRREVGRRKRRRSEGEEGGGEEANEAEFKRVRQTWTEAIFSSWSWGTGAGEVEEYEAEKRHKGKERVDAAGQQLFL